MKDGRAQNNKTYIMYSNCWKIEVYVTRFHINWTVNPEPLDLTLNCQLTEGRAPTSKDLEMSAATVTGFKMEVCNVCKAH